MRSKLRLKISTLLILVRNAEDKTKADAGFRAAVVKRGLWLRLRLWPWLRLPVLPVLLSSGLPRGLWLRPRLWLWLLPALPVPLSSGLLRGALASASALALASAVSLSCSASSELLRGLWLPLRLWPWLPRPVFLLAFQAGFFDGPWLPLPPWPWLPLPVLSCSALIGLLRGLWLRLQPWPWLPQPVFPVRL